MILLKKLSMYFLNRAATLALCCQRHVIGRNEHGSYELEMCSRIWRWHADAEVPRTMSFVPLCARGASHLFPHRWSKRSRIRSPPQLSTKRWSRWTAGMSWYVAAEWASGLQRAGADFVIAGDIAKLTSREPCKSFI